MGSDRPKRGTKGSGTTCMVEFPDRVREAADKYNTERKQQKQAKIALAVILEAMICAGIDSGYDWVRYIQEISERKAQTQTGRGRPRIK